MTSPHAKEFTYQISWRARGQRPGSHASMQHGLGMEFRGHAPLIAYPDPRRIDLRQTLRDPFEQVWVRICNQKSAVPVIMVCDLSGSMRFSGKRHKMEIAAEIAAAAAWSAFRANDPFGFVGFDAQVREDWLLTPTTRIQGGFGMAERLASHQPDPVGTEGLASAGSHLPRERSLILLVSDFHTPLPCLEEGLMGMARHQVVPIVLWDAAEYRDLPQFGIVHMNDSEDQARRTLFLRKGLRERIVRSFAARRAALEALFLRYDMPPLFLEGEFRAEDLTEYFNQFVAAR